MIYPDTAVRANVYSLLKEAKIPAYDSEVPTSEKPPYVLLQGQDNTDSSTKSGYGFIHKITLASVVVGPAATGRQDAETLLNKVLSALTAEKPAEPVKIALAAPFRCWKVKAMPSKDLVFTGAAESVYQKIVTLELMIDYQP